MEREANKIAHTVDHLEKDIIDFKMD